MLPARNQRVWADPSSCRCTVAANFVQESSNREHPITFTGDRLQAVRWRQFRYYLVDVTATGSGASRQEGLAGAYRPMHYPLIFDIEADPREEFNANVYRGWVAGHASRIIGGYLQSLAKHPNPPAPNLTDFRGNP